MKKWFFLLAVIILICLQLSWPGFLSFFNCKPDLLLALIMASAFYLDFKTALLFSLLGGAAKDLFIAQPFAVNTVTFGIWSYSVYLLNRQISTDVLYIQSALVLVASLLNNMISGILIINSGGVIPLGMFLRNLIISSFYTTALSPLFFRFAKKIAA